MEHNHRPERLINEAEAARYIGMSRAFLRRTRMEGALPRRTAGPPFVRIGRAIRYAVDDLDVFIDQHRHSQSSVPGEEADDA